MYTFYEDEAYVNYYVEEIIIYYANGFTIARCNVYGWQLSHTFDSHIYTLDFGTNCSETASLSSLGNVDDC